MSRLILVTVARNSFLIKSPKTVFIGTHRHTATVAGAYFLFCFYVITTDRRGRRIDKTILRRRWADEQRACRYSFPIFVECNDKIRATTFNRATDATAQTSAPWWWSLAVPLPHCLIFEWFENKRKRIYLAVHSVHCIEHILPDSIASHLSHSMFISMYE